MTIDEERRSAAEAQLRSVFSALTAGKIVGMPVADFSRRIHAELGRVDASGEGFAEAEVDRQRDLSVRFHWGHNHDFGEFRLRGRMGDRHITVLANFATLFDLPVDELTGKDVFDIGCWTGGTALLWAALGARVVAIEEVRKYAEVTRFLAKAFGFQDRLRVEAVSLYACNRGEYAERFDIVNFPGVVYHLSDPVVALRILFNSLKIGGTLLVESAGIDAADPVCRFEGSLVHHSGTRENLDRGGWNWFVPSPAALGRMMREAGFDEVRTLWDRGTGRVYGCGKRTGRPGICRAGLSVPDIA